MEQVDTKDEEKVESIPTDLAIKKIHNDPASSRISDTFNGENHEVEMCYEADIHKRVSDCKKNPGHKGFIPLKDFNINCLPSRYRDDDLMFKTIKALAAITVKIETKFTSLERPELYPRYKNRGSHVMGLGTGRVCEVLKYTKSDEICRCAKCQVSATPSKVWGEIRVLTATHVVFDDSEARQTRCVLGFDDDNSAVINLDGWEVFGSPNIERDLRWLGYNTCNLELLDNVGEIWRCYDRLCGETRYQYRRFLDEDKLTVIVSHPHGLPKQVSVGQWTHKHKKDGTWTRYWYTTCTCPGSSGSSVYRLECDGLFQHTHSGSGLGGNVSGVYGDTGSTCANEYEDWFKC